MRLHVEILSPSQESTVLCAPFGLGLCDISLSSFSLTGFWLAFNALPKSIVDGFVCFVFVWVFLFVCLFVFLLGFFFFRSMCLSCILLTWPNSQRH